MISRPRSVTCRQLNSFSHKLILTAIALLVYSKSQGGIVIYQDKIKEVIAPRFEIRLLQLPSGQYCIGYQKTDDEEPSFSEPLIDLGLALHLFDVKLQELEGM